MCCFSRPVQSVSGTSIFVRAGAGGRQLLAYSMRYDAGEDLAMILPLPVKRGSGESAVRFINLEHYGRFFEDLRAGFPDPIPASAMRGPPPQQAARGLAVHSVGSFEASFVPTVKDFGRLDVRFRLPTVVWERLPAYKDAGFAVFKLKKGSLSVHPMALEFPRERPSELFFPTVHIHDGKVHDTALFDHALYCQASGGEISRLSDWRESDRPARTFMTLDRAKGLIDPDGHCYLRRLSGSHRNEDILL